MSPENEQTVRSVAQIWESGHCSRLSLRFEGENYVHFHPLQGPPWSLFIPVGMTIDFGWLLRVVTKRGADN